MKKTLITLMFLCIAGLAMAQEANETEFKMSIGDTIIWKPFDDCNMMNLNRLGEKAIDFKVTGKFFDRVQIIALRKGNCGLKAICGDNGQETLANIIVYDPNEVPVIVEKPVKPATQAFTSTSSIILPFSAVALVGSPVAAQLVSSEKSHFTSTYGGSISGTYPFA